MAHTAAAMVRSRTWLTVPLVAFLLLLLLAHSAPGDNGSGSAENLVTFVPTEDTNAVLHNPDMGWVLYENYPLDPDPQGSSTMLRLPGEDFPEADAVALMFSWQDVEAREGGYDFSRVDQAYDHWRARRKTIQLRMSTESLLYWGKRNPPAGMGVPPYVLARMAASEKQTRTMDGETYVVVDARNPFYRARLSAFLGAVSEHFDSRRPVTLIDLRGFGLWGEWHSGFRYPDLETRRAALKGILDIWSEAFPRHLLALSGSYDPAGPKELYAGPYNRFDPVFTTNYESYLQFSGFDYALTKTNITFRRDGCGGAVHSNERKLIDEAFYSLRRAPMFGEFLGGYGFVKKGGSNWVSWLVEDALSLHCNYINLVGWQGGDAREFIRERPDLVAHGLRQMGYRLVPTQVQCPRILTNGVPFEVRFDWVNRGVGRALCDYEMQLWLMGTGVAKAAMSPPSTLKTSHWFRGNAYSVTRIAEFRDTPAGEYQLAVHLRDTATQTTIKLPLAPAGTDGRYPIGKVQVSPGRPSRP